MTKWLLDAVLRLLPAARREWGQAMRAELAAIDRDQARWRFALSCTRVVLAHPVMVRRAGHPLLALAVLAGAFGWTSRMAYPPLRWGAFGLAVLLLAIAWGGRTLDPVGGRAARLVRAGGLLVVGGMLVEFVSEVVGKGDPAGKVGAPLSVFTVLIAGLLVAVLTVTAARSAATGRVLASGVGAGVGAAGLWTVAVLIAPPIPTDVGLGLTLTTVAVAVAVLANAGERGSVVGRLLAALLAGTLAQLLIFLLVVLLSSHGPAVLIPDLAPAALTPADDLADSRNEVVDPYVALLFLGGLAAMALSVASVATRRKADEPLLLTSG